MCFNFAASASSAVTGVFTAFLLVWLLLDQEDRAAARGLAFLVMFMLLPAGVEFADACAHLRHRGRPIASERAVGLLCYTLIAWQPVTLSIALVLTEDATDPLGRAVLLLTAAICVSYWLGSLSFDRPVNTWLRIAVVEMERFHGLVHGFYAHEGGKSAAFGLASRKLVYTLGLVVAGLGWLAHGIEMLAAGHALLGGAVLFSIGSHLTLLALSVLVANCAGVRGHVSSVWCQLSLLSNVAMVVLLSSGRELPLQVLLSVVPPSLWLSLYAIFARFV